jgi:diguanylate cyclase (GGDEF)-like protein
MLGITSSNREKDRTLSKMDLTEQWYKEVDGACDDLAGVFVTGQEFENTLQRLIIHPDSPMHAVEYQLHLNPPFENVTFGKSSSELSTRVETIPNFDDQYGSSCRITIWLKKDHAYDTAKITDHLSRLIKSYWKPHLRDKSLLISLDSPERKKIADNSIVRFLQTTDVLFVLFCDLDEFKKINSRHGHDTGDRIILELSSVIHKTIGSYAIPLHRSGDEFAIFYPTQNPDEVLFLARDLMQSMTKHDYKLDEVKISISAGITVTSRDQELASYESLELRAEKALQPTEEIKYRGMARFELREGIDLPVKNEFSLNKAYCLIKSCLNITRPFESPWLNMISRHTYELLQGKKWDDVNIRTSVRELIDWIQPEFDENIVRTALPINQCGNFSPIFSAFDVVLAVAHGVFSAKLRTKELDTGKSTLEICYNKTSQGDCYLRLMPDDVPLVILGDTETATETWNLGGFVHIADAEHVDSVDTRRALLVKIGSSDLKIPASIFVDEIIVDDRPTRGGGLPDFWEATIAKVINYMNINSNIAAVYIMGTREHGAQTIDKLLNSEVWKTNTEQISYKTGMPFQSIHTAADRLHAKVNLPSSEESLVQSLTAILLSSYELQPTTPPTNLHSSRRFMRRDMPNTGAIALGIKDGCRTGTVSEAFPIVLEIARKSGGEEIITDQAGRTLKELMDFKVHLTNPNQDIVPAFYEKEEESLKKYFHDQFISETGLFGAVFNGPQLNVVLDHLVQTITNPKRPSTRRAVLVVPTDTRNSDKDFTPLGLISVRIIPRFPQNRILLHYSYTWRTVEALVGFPYSLYGSVRYSQYLTEALSERLQPEYQRRLTMGDVSYIAHSLHIFMDEYGENIARKIVEDVTS